VAVIAPDPAASRELYVGALGLPLEGQGNGYYHSEQIAGCKSFGIWPLSQAAEACFGTPRWPAERAVPQVSIEFDVGDAAAVGRQQRNSKEPGTNCCTQRAQSRGSDGRQATVAGRRDRRHLVPPGHAAAWGRGACSNAPRCQPSAEKSSAPSKK
jgi:hypothetical protein